MLTHEASIDGSTLQKAIETTFTNRSTQLPDGLPIQFSQSFTKEKQRQWDAFVNRERIESGEIAIFAQVVQRLNDFLSPVVDATKMRTDFDNVWNPAAGWEEV